jgi:hypothetical protein
MTGLDVQHHLTSCDIRVPVVGFSLFRFAQDARVGLSEADQYD